jgi:hypothetical protein
MKACGEKFGGRAKGRGAEEDSMRGKRCWGIALTATGVVVVGVLAIVFWPVPDPLAGVETVALRLGEDPDSEDVGTWFEDELKIVLNNRNITIVAEEARADAVLTVDDVTLNLGDVELSFTEGSFRGRVSAECTLTDVTTGKQHRMDFTLRFEDNKVNAKLVPRKFWQFWR